MSDIQARLDGWAAQSRLERIESESIMNLGDLIDALSKFDGTARVVVNVVATDENPDGTKLVYQHSGEPHHRWYEPGLYPALKVSSYRGYYSDLAIELDSYMDNPGYDPSLTYSWDEPRSYKAIRMPQNHVTTVGPLLKNLSDAVGQTFEGYKGGDYRMSRLTPMWVSNYGDAAGLMVTGVEMVGSVVVITTANEDF